MELQSEDGLVVVVYGQRFQLARDRIHAAGAYFTAFHSWSQDQEVHVALPLIKLPGFVTTIVVSDSAALFATYLTVLQAGCAPSSMTVADLLSLAVLGDYLLCPAVIEICDDALLQRALPESGSASLQRFCQTYRLERTAEGLRWASEHQEKALVRIRDLVVPSGGLHGVQRLWAYFMPYLSLA